MRGPTRASCAAPCTRGPYRPTPGSGRSRSARPERPAGASDHSPSEPEVLQHRLVPFVILLPIGRPDAATNPGCLSVAPRPPDEPMGRRPLDVEAQGGPIFRGGLEALDLEWAE